MQETAFPSTLFTCPECGAELDPNKVSIYKHALGCMRLPDIGSGQILQRYREGDSEYAKRVVALMQAAQGEGR